MAKKILSIALALIMALSVFAVAASATDAVVIETTAATFTNDVKTAPAGATVVLTEDIAFTAMQQINTGKSVTIDLAGYAITSTADKALVFTGSATNVTIIDSVGTGSVSAKTASVQDQGGATLTIEGGTYYGKIYAVGPIAGSIPHVIINGGTFNAASSAGGSEISATTGSYKGSAVEVYHSAVATINGGTFNAEVFVVDSGSTLVVNGGTFTSDDYCIVGNGTKSGTSITINGGTFTATGNDAACIYHPQGGSLIINDGEFEGPTALYIKSGTTLINGGTFVGNDEAAAYRYYGNGFYTTGDAIVVDSCGYPSGTPVVRIYDGDFSSENAASVKGYTYGNNAAPIICIYDGEFSDDAAETYASTTAVYNSTTGVSYDTFEEAAQAAAAKDTLVLYKDVVVGAYTVVTDVTIDLSGNDITSAGNAPLDAYGTVTVKDSIGGGKIAGAARGIWVNTGAKVTINKAEVDGVVTEGALTITNAYIDGYVSAFGEGSSVSVTGTTTTVTGQIAVQQGTLSVNNGTFANVYVYNGATATITNGTYNLISVYADGVATIKNGTFGAGYFATGASATIKKGTFNGQINVSDGGTLTIDGGTFNEVIVPVGGWPVNGDADATAAKAEYVSTLIVNDGTFTAEDYCISGNGTDVGTAVITINGGTFTASSVEGVAIYQPQSGTTTINGGTFTGADAIYQKSGNITINGGTFYAKGSKAAYRHSGNGFNPTGDTIVVDTCGYPGGAPSLTINGGAFYTKYNEIIGYYVYGDNALDSTGFVVNGAFSKEVPAQFWANADAFTLFNVTGGTATYDENTNTITILADEGSEKIEVLRLATNGKIVTFSDVSGGAKISKQYQLYARTPGTAVATIDGVDYNIVITFQSFDVEDLLVVTNATMAVEGSTITLTPVDASEQITVSPRTSADTAVEFGATTGYAKVSSGGSLYAKNYGTAVITVPNAGTFTVVFDLADIPFVDTLRTTNATVAVSGTTITLTPVDTTKSVSLVNVTWNRKDITFSNLSKYGKISGNGSFYSNKYATATATVDGTDYTVVIAFAQVPVAQLLQANNATIAVEGTTITLTPVDNTKTASLAKWLTDGTLVTFAAGAGSKVSSGGTLYAKEPAVGTATFDGVTYDVVFDFTPIIPTIDELLTIKGATMSVSGTTITLTATSTQINVYPTLTDGSKATFSNLSGGAKTAKAGTLYAKYAGSATVTVAGVDYTVNFVF